SDQRLYITVPQAWQNRSYQGYVDPSLWDNGINAATLSYSLNAALLGNRKVTVPYRGAVVLVDFETETSKPFYFLARRADGEPLT
ncbi:hypothetical protein ONO57_25270, partial [Salmonella enterica subsp. enterica serovar Anatum]|nr:hypothetical protein [Salmonella enterica subsp. enterica serovar Anatum]